MYPTINLIRRNTTMMFSPHNYTSLVALREDSVLGAHSNTTIDNIDVFGFFEGNAYACKYIYDEDMDADVAYAGDCIDVEYVEEQGALEALKEICERNGGDIEVMHMEADELLCALLEKDYPNLVAQYKALPKWYA